MEVEQEARAGVVVLRPVGRLDSFTSRAFEERILAVIDDTAGALVVDFDGLDYVSSAGLRVMLMAAKRMKAAGRTIVLAAMSASIRGVFDVSGFSALFEIHDDRDAAIAAVS